MARIKAKAPCGVFRGLAAEAWAPATCMSQRGTGLEFISLLPLWHSTFLFVRSLLLLLQGLSVFEHLGWGVVVVDDLSQMYSLHFPDYVFVYFLRCF